MKIFSSLNRLRITGIAEGLSFLGLLLIAMPLKYLLDIPQAVQVIGLLHGILFVLYILFVIEVGITKNWTIKKIGLLFLASIVPLGTFWADQILLKKESRDE